MQLKQVTLDQLIGYYGGQKNFANECNVTTQTIYNIRKGIANPSFPLALRIKELANEQGFDIDFKSLEKEYRETPIYVN